jgi:hypothetical protein
MKKLISIAFCALAGMFASAGAHAGGISDNGVNGYWGADGHGRGDVIGGSIYDVYGAAVAKVGSVLTFTIGTNFAGHAGADSWSATNGIGYGDLFLASAWNPSGSDAHHNGDNASNGTKWQFGLSLNNRWSNTGGTFKLYQLKGATNAANILNSESFMNCDLPNTPDCTYRNGQATAVKTHTSTGGSNSANAKFTNVTGNWTVQADKSITFTFDAATTSLVNLTSFALHWGETCQNDVIEGVVSIVPTPASLPLIALGLGMLVALRRRTPALKQH